MIAIEKNPNAVALGRLGGLKGVEEGGKARWKGVSAAERSRIARKAVEVRWVRYYRRIAAGQRGL